MAHCPDKSCDSQAHSHCKETITTKGDYWICTRPVGHYGPHVACSNRYHNIETWGEGAPGLKPKYFRQLLVGVKS